MTELHARCLLTIVCEELLESRIEAELEQLGAPGWTATHARGNGDRGRREAHWENDGNVRIEVVCTRSLATAIAEHLHDRYYSDYAMVCWLGDVQVLRPEKF